MLRTDLKIFKAERMTQQADAGGQRTANEVQNGQLNEVFGNISDIDHAQSAVDIAKIYPAVSTANTNLLQDGHILINEPPLDPLVDVMIVEANGVNDGSTRADIVEAIESGVIASLALRTGLSEMLAGQDALNALDLQPFNAPLGEQPTVTLTVGQTYAISVEYTGNEDPAWPRFTHFIKITAQDLQTVTFEPALPLPTPGRSRVINSQTRCTVLRAVTTSDNVTYHGVTQLTEATAGTILNVERTTGRVTPRITEAVSRLNNSPFAAESGLIRSEISLAAIGVSYSVEISDFIDVPSHQAFIIKYISGNIAYQQTLSNSSLTGTQLDFALTRTPDAGTNVLVQYLSSARYDNYSNAGAITAGYSLLIDTVQGTVNKVSNSTRYSIKRDPADSTRLLVQYYSPLNYNELAAVIDANDGTATYYNGYNDLQYTAVIQNDAAAGESASAAEFAMPYAEVLSSTFYVTVEKVAGGLLSASGEIDGSITGVDVTGTIVKGYVTLAFAQAVKLSTLKYNIDEVVQLTPPSNIYGINPLRLANSGQVAMFRQFGVISVASNQFQTEATLSPAQVIARRPNSFIDIVDSTGASLWHPLNTYYEYDKATGNVTITDASNFTGPFEIIDTLSELALVTAVTDNTLKLTAALTNTFPIGSIVSSVCAVGDLQARTTNMFDQNTWDGTWADVIKGDPATANYNAINYPIEVANQSAVNEQWAIIFTSDTAFRCVGKNVGQVASGDILNDFSPINPATNQPFFIIRNSGWGGGWQPGNVLRFNTVAASKPAVLLRSVSAGHSAIEQDSIRLHFRGNAE
jgi:hypothetical protein